MQDVSYQLVIVFKNIDTKEIIHTETFHYKEDEFDLSKLEEQKLNKTIQLEDQEYIIQKILPIEEGKDLTAVEFGIFNTIIFLVRKK